jgi:hypothetical protein
MEVIRYPTTTPWLLTNRKTWTTIKETTRRIHFWIRNRTFIGLTSWPVVMYSNQYIARLVNAFLLEHEHNSLSVNAELKH